MALTSLAFLPRALVGSVSQHMLSLTAPFGVFIAIPPDTGIEEDSKKAFNKQIQKRNQIKKKKKFKKIRRLRYGDFAVVFHPSTNYTRTGLTLVDTIAGIYM